MMRTTIAVQNLKCSGCVNTITSKLSEIKNINNVLVDKIASTVTFRYNDPDDALLVKEKLKTLGYPMVNEKNSFTTRANSFMSCADGKKRSKQKV